MINLKNDYSGIAHPEILKVFEENKENNFVGYGMDETCEKAKEAIKRFFGLKDSLVEFAIGGTSANKIVIGHTLRPYEAVIACDTGHINVHETGAIEETGHKVLTVPNCNGKMNPIDVEKVIKSHSDCHMVKPKMVYISNPTEYGTIYTKAELSELRDVCNRYNLYLYMDGARLGALLGSDKNDLLPEDIAKFTDAFYIGGTKNGMPIGEAIVINNDSMKNDIKYSIKHFGGMLAKGFLVGIPFERAFRDDLYVEIGKKEDELASLLQTELSNIGVELLFESPTNQIFPIFTKKEVEELKKHILFEVWEERENSTVIRFVVSYQTTKENVNKAIESVKNVVKR